MNATQLLAFRSQAQGVMEGLYPCSVVISGVTYTGSWSGLTRLPRENGDGGHELVMEATIRVQRSLFARAEKQVPEDGWKLVANGTGLQVESVTDDPSDVAVTLRCSALVVR